MNTPWWINSLSDENESLFAADHFQSTFTIALFKTDHFIEIHKSRDG